MTHWPLSNVLLSLQLFAYFLLLFLLLGSSFNAFCSDTMHRFISIFLYLPRLALCPKIWSILKNVPWAAEKNVHCEKLDEIFCRHQLSLFELWCDLVLEFLYWFLVWITYLLVIGGVLRSPTTTVLESIYAFRSFRVCLIKLGTLTLGAYRLIIVISFWFISSFINMECPSLSHLINVSLKSTCPR
jgi:hypothetical protein